MEETLETLISYCAENDRAVPVPSEWSRLYQLLKNTRRTPSEGSEPALPLILAVWDHSMPIEKVLRFREHLAWAEKEGQIEEVGRFLRGLSEDQWAHYGELPT